MPVMSMKPTQSQHRDITRCFVCSKVYSSARQLPCVHTFCLPCLERVGVNKRTGDVVECPLCRHEFHLPQHGFVGLPRDAFVEELAEVDKMVDQALSETQCDSCFETATSSRTLNGVCVVSPPAVVHCIDCVQNLCLSCCSSLCKMQSTDDDVKTGRHRVVELSTHLSRTLRRDVRYCDRHADEPVTTYCFDCRAALCGCCSSGRTHRIHRCAPVEAAASEFRQQLQHDVEAVVERRRRCVDETDRVQQERRQFVDAVDKTAAAIRQTEERMKRLISEHASKLMHQLDTLKTETMQKVDAVRSDMDRFLAVADNFLQYAETLQERGTAVDMTRTGDDLLVRATMLRKMRFTETGGETYRTPGVSFTPWYDMEDLLTNDDDNVVGRITSVSRSQDATLSSQCSLSPSVVQTMLEDSRAVLGVAAVSGHVYVVRSESPEVEVYSAVTWSLKRRLAVPGLRSPTDLAACERTAGRLFVADWPECRIHRVVDVQRCRRGGLGGTATENGGGDAAEAVNGNWSKSEETGWSTAERPWSLSLVEGERHCTVVVTCDQAAKLYEYTEFGSVLRQVCLAAELSNPRHAVLLNTGRFVVSLKDSICLVGADGRRILPNKSSSPAGGGRIGWCGRLAVDDGGGLLVLDVDGRRVVQFDATNVDELRLVRDVVPRDDARLRYPARLSVDRRRRRLYVADNELSQRTRLQAKFWGKTGRVVVYDIHPSL